MEGFVTVGITLFVIWILGKVMAEKPEDAVKQTPWHHFKRRFRAGRIYHLFAARSRERMYGELFLYYILIGLGLLLPVGILMDFSQPVLELSELKTVSGRLAQIELASSVCKSTIAIESQHTAYYRACLDKEKEARLLKIIGQPVTAWVSDEKPLFGMSTTWIKQLQHGSELIIDYAEIHKNNVNAKKNGWKYFGVIPLAFALAALWTVAQLNIRKYGRWSKLEKGE